MSKKLTTKEFIERSNITHNNKYNYELVDYKNHYTKVNIICKTHGVFSQNPKNHFNGTGCPLCSPIEKGRKEIISKFKKIHGEKFDYSEVNYINHSTKVSVKCKKHGIFEIVPRYHLIGGECPICSNDFNVFKKLDWIEQAKERLGIFYIIRCAGETETFYKLGITFNSIKKRYSGKTRLPYNYEIIKEIKSKDLDYIWNLEKRFKRLQKRNHYIPKIYFKGSNTECFKK